MSVLSTFHITAGDGFAKLSTTALQSSPFLQLLVTFSSHSFKSSLTYVSGLSSPYTLPSVKVNATHFRFLLEQLLISRYQNSFLLLLLCRKLPQKLRGLNQQFYFAHDFVHQKFEKSLAEQFSLEVIHAVAIRCQPGLQTSDDLTGLDFQDGSLIRLRVDAGCQLQAQLGCRSECLHVGSPAWQSQDTWPSYMVPVSPRANIPKEPGKRLF